VFGEAQQGEQGSVKQEQSRPGSRKRFRTEKRGWVVVDCEVQKNDQMANRGKTKDDQQEVRAYLPSQIPALAVN
jgi:hypothetical protein